MVLHKAQFTWDLSEVEALKASDWMNTHECKRKKHQYFSFTFTPNSLGVSCIVKCNCGKKEDITDYHSW